MLFRSHVEVFAARGHRDLAVAACREHLNVHRLDELRDSTVHDLLLRCDAFRKPGRIDRLATVCEADKRGRLGHEDAAYPQADALRRLHAAACAVNARDLALDGLDGPAVGEALRKARIAAIHAARGAPVRAAVWLAIWTHWLSRLPRILAAALRPGTP